MEEQIANNPIKTKIVGEHYIEQYTGKIVFTNNGKPIYGNYDALKPKYEKNIDE